MTTTPWSPAAGTNPMQPTRPGSLAAEAVAELARCQGTPVSQEAAERVRQPPPEAVEQVVHP